MVVKIKAKILLFGLIAIFMLSISLSAVSATNQTMLDIKDLDVKVGGSSDKNLLNNSHISEDAKPEDTIKFNFEIENLYDDNNGDLDIEDIVVTVNINDIDDGDDMEEESDEFDLDPEEDDDVSLEFELPLKIEEGTFDVEINVEGEDENGTVHEIEWFLTLDVDKETHDIRILRTTLSRETVECSRNTDLRVTLINLGADEEDDVYIQVKNTALEIDQKSTEVEMSEDIDDDDNEYSKTFYFDIAEDVKAGTYPIDIIVNYRNDREQETGSVNLVVKDCEEYEEEEEETTTQQQTTTTQEEATVVIVEETTSVEEEYSTPVPQVTYGEVEESFMSKYGFGILIGLGYIVVLGLIGYVAYLLFFKK